jgi:hypothetical protein
MTTRLPKIELSKWVYENWYKKEHDRQNACGVFTNIPQFKFAPRKLKAKILKEYQKQLAKNKAHNDSLPSFGIDILTMQLVQLTKGGAK